MQITISKFADWQTISTACTEIALSHLKAGVWFAQHWLSYIKEHMKKYSINKRESGDLMIKQEFSCTECRKMTLNNCKN